jgi:hypothetical protein
VDSGHSRQEEEKGRDGKNDRWMVSGYYIDQAFIDLKARAN